MGNKTKIHEIAKKMGLSSKEVLEKAHALGIEVSSHLSGVDEQDAKKIEESLKTASNNTEENPKKQKEKKTKKEATDMYLDYFIKYQLNPILDQRKAKEKVRAEQTKTKADKTIQLQKIAEDRKTKKEKTIEKEDITL